MASSIANISIIVHFHRTLNQVTVEYLKIITMFGEKSEESVSTTFFALLLFSASDIGAQYRRAAAADNGDALLRMGELHLGLMLGAYQPASLESVVSSVKSVPDARPSTDAGDALPTSSSTPLSPASARTAPAPLLSLTPQPPSTQRTAANTPHALPSSASAPLSSSSSPSPAASAAALAGLASLVARDAAAAVEHFRRGAALRHGGCAHALARCYATGLIAGMSGSATGSSSGSSGSHHHHAPPQTSASASASPGHSLAIRGSGSAASSVANSPSSSANPRSHSNSNSNSNSQTSLASVAPAPAPAAAIPAGHAIKAFEWYRTAAELGHAPAIFALAQVLSLCLVLFCFIFVAPWCKRRQ